MKTGLKPWIVVFSAALFFFYEFIQMNMISSLAPLLMNDFSIDATKLGNLSATYFYSCVLFLLPAGQILDRISTRKVILTALLICVLGTFCFAAAKIYYLAVLSRLCTGIGSAFCFLSCIRLASRWFPNDKLALVSGLVVTMAMLGGTIAQTPLTLLIHYMGSWRHAIMVDGAVGLIFWIIIFFTVQNYPKDNLQACDKDQAALEKFGYWQAMRTSYLTLRNWLCAFYTCFMNLPIFLIGGGGFGSLYLQQVKHLSVLQSSYPPMMIFFGTVIGSPLAGWISDHMGLRRLPMQIGAIISFILMFIFINISASYLSMLFYFSY
jgi:predicted MFS family arabinose efflux permease